MRKRFAALALAFLALFAVCAPAAAAGAKNGYKIAAENGERFADLLDLLRRAYLSPSGKEEAAIDRLTEQIAEASADDGDIARAIAEHWKTVYLDKGYKLCVWWGRETAQELKATHPDYSDRHAFVILGYQLKDGKMQDELIGRCRAAAAAAKSYPDSVIICSGGETGSNNPDHNTEAGLMKQFLVFRCGIDASRIITDTNALTTLANAENTFAILRKKGITSITIVTSDYHQRWGQVLYNAMAALYEKRFGFSVRIVGNYCYETGADEDKYLAGARMALNQLSEMLNIRRKK